MKSVVHNRIAAHRSRAAFFSALDHGPIFASSSRKKLGPPASVIVSGGYSHSVRRQATYTVSRLQGRKANSHWPQKTSTLPNFVMAPAAVIEPAPARSILSKRFPV